MADNKDDSSNSIHVALPTLILNTGEEIPIPSDSSGLSASDMNSSEQTSLYSASSSAEREIEIEYDFDAFLERKSKRPAVRHDLLRPKAAISKGNAQNGGIEHAFPSSSAQNGGTEHAVGSFFFFC